MRTFDWGGVYHVVVLSLGLLVSPADTRNTLALPSHKALKTMGYTFGPNFLQGKYKSKRVLYILARKGTKTNSHGNRGKGNMYSFDDGLLEYSVLYPCSISGT